jgi:RNA polymerase sigma-70 factor (ECF subfamily)
MIGRPVRRAAEIVEGPRDFPASAGNHGDEVLRPIPATTEEPDVRPSFAELYRAHFAFVWRLVRALGVDRAWVDDVVHDVFLVARRRMDTFDAERSARAWLAGITRNLVMHHARSTARRLRRLAAVPPPEPDAGPEHWYAQGEAARAVERFIATLTAEQREVFVLMEIERMTAREVEAVVGVNHRTLHTRLRSARAAFARFIDALHGGSEP